MRHSLKRKTLQNVGGAVVSVSTKMVRPAVIILIGFAITTALNGHSGQSVANNEATNTADETGSVSEADNRLQAEADQTSEEQSTQDQSEAASADSDRAGHERNSNSIKLEINASTSSSSGSSSDADMGGAESQPHVFINGDEYELPRNGRIKERIKEETETTETDTRIKVDVDGGENTTIRINGG